MTTHADPSEFSTQTDVENTVVTFDKYGGPEVLSTGTEAINDLASGQVRVRMKALALNRANALFREGTYLYEASFPARIGTEGVGVIDAIAPDVTGLKLGQRVNLLPPDDESTSGYAAEFNTVPASKVLPAPEGLSDRDAATAWVPFLTLYHHFVEQQQAAPGRWIVLPAASSSVSLAANSLAHHLGAKTIGITRTAQKKAALEVQGFDAVIVAQDEDITARIIEVSDGGADFVFDPVGGAQLEKLVSAVKSGSEINVYGGLDVANTALPVFAMMGSGARISCYVLYELFGDPTRLKAAVDYYLPLFESGAIAPVADGQTFDLANITAAFQHMESNTQLGKVVVTC
ncbi:zinc-binding dehydrogenase [Parasedimentitalea huanghaiensis]|uniref:Zinc-binding dehydrogenase n=1 Tax=Parasedimentitalea huanghaiensis TaxID=2682100 RepID=A0A6L6WK63_9RHOB|nr:zinc-binding dehydrogenase [Zongyanglinia huanghaiensis]MVO17761.1 zinc-binding dehydrogenase [Zongyanglinia huanghaiensis]